VKDRGGGEGLGGPSGECYSVLRDVVSMVELRSSIRASQPSLAERLFSHEFGSAEMDRPRLTNNQ
jgi:hypothetical protein